MAEPDDKEIDRPPDVECPYCGFEIDTDDCTCQGLGALSKDNTCQFIT